MPMLDSASAWLDRTLAVAAGVSVVLRRGAAKSATVTAVVGSTEYDESNGDGIIERRQSRDYLIAKLDYVINGVTEDPCEGDIIEEGDRRYRVSPMSDEPPARHSDAEKRMWRIHTKLVCE